MKKVQEIREADKEIEERFLNYILGGQYDAAEIYLLQVQSEAKSNAQVYTYYLTTLLLGICLQQRGHLTSALKYLKKVFKQNRFLFLKLRADIHISKVMSQYGDYKMSSKYLENSLENIRMLRSDGVIDSETESSLILPILWRLGVEHKLMGNAKKSQRYIDEHSNKSDGNLYQVANRFAIEGIMNISDGSAKNWERTQDIILKAQEIYVNSKIENQTSFANKLKPLVGMFFLHLMLKARMGNEFEALVKANILKHLMKSMKIEVSSEGFSEMITPMNDLKPQLQELLRLDYGKYEIWLKKQANKAIVTEASKHASELISPLSKEQSLEVAIQNLTLNNGEFTYRDLRTYLMSDLKILARISELFEPHFLLENFDGITSFKDVVAKITEIYKGLIEKRQTHKLLWDKGEDVPKSENDAQLLFEAIARPVCKLLNIDISREVHAGPGIADFKISKGDKDKAVIELKLASNKKFWNGLLKQVPAYMEAEEVILGYLIGICFTDKEIELLTKIQNKYATMKIRNDVSLVIVDARKKVLSASQL